MKKIRKNNHATLNLPSIKLEGSLLLPDQLEKAALGNAKHQTEADYQIPKGLKIKDEYSRAFQIACAQWKHFTRLQRRADLDNQQTTETFVRELLRDAFAYTDLTRGQWLDYNERHYPVSLLAGHLPIVVAPHATGLDEADPRFAIEGSGSRKKSAFQLAQELLNATDNHLWAMVTNGRQLRLLRDADTLTRPSYLEFDLEDILEGQCFSEFASVWRLLHASRAAVAAKPENAIWESWRETGKEEGTRVRDGLRNGVEQALLTLGEGFIQHSDNSVLRQQLDSGELSKDAYFQQLLRLIYRLIFLFSVEERGLLHPQDETQKGQAARRAYAQGYAMARLRDLCLKRRSRNRFDDQWQALRIVFKGLAKGESRLALPALGGLFAETQCPQIDRAALSNAHLLTVMQHLRWASHNGNLAPVDYRNMGPEELGSVYESLLELVPEIDLHARKFGFVGITSEGSTAGNARKTSGSYYTPDSLVQELIKSALEPVIEQRLKDNSGDPVRALLSIRVIDPACGSGHFLLAAARRLAEKLAELRAVDGVVKPQDYRHALREVVSHCIFGVDRNPMALELARTALWLEGFEEGRPLSFLDHHLQCGDALLGLTDLKALEYGIPKAAFKALSGDDKDICKALNKKNTAELKEQEKKRTAQLFGQLDSLSGEETGLAALRAIEALPQESTADIQAKEQAYKAFLEQAKNSHLRHAADMLLGAFLLAKTEESAALIPTTSAVILEMMGEQKNRQYEPQLLAATEVCHEVRVFHWPLAFPQIFSSGGFDCVLGNPPWEVSQLSEEEYFTTRAPHIAVLLGSVRKKAIAEIETQNPRLWGEYQVDKRRYEAGNSFYRESGRYPLTAVGKINTYPLFSETISQIMAKKGLAGFIVPTGIATDDSTKAYFGHITQSGRLVSLYDFENREGLFPAVDSRMKFCLLTLGEASEAEFAFFLTQTSQLSDDRRRFVLSSDDFVRINPNTLTCPLFRSRMDAELTRKVYRRVPVLIREAQRNREEQNPWGISFRQGLFNMTSDSHLFIAEEDDDYLPLYEAKMIHQFDHRWSKYRIADGHHVDDDVSLVEKQNFRFSVTPRYWVSAEEVCARLSIKGWDKQWLLGFRDICRVTDERTAIASVVPRVGVGHTMPIIYTELGAEPCAVLLANFNSLVLDFIARVKVGGTHLTYGYLKQFPVLTPDSYLEKDLFFIIPRVLELTYTAYDMQSWANDLTYDGEPFLFDPVRREVIRAELDAYYAKLYGLTRDELRYILDPADVMGEDYPSETFRVLKNKEIKEFGEYRTQRLVLREFDRLTLAEEAGEPYISLLVPPPGQHSEVGYSSHGIIRDEQDARLAGLLLALIGKAESLPRQSLTMALVIAQDSNKVRTLVSSEEFDSLGRSLQKFKYVLTQERIDRFQALLRYFENVGAIRIAQQGSLVRVASVTPQDVVVDGEMEEIAGMLLRVVNKYQEQVSSSATDSETQIPIKRA